MAYSSLPDYEIEMFPEELKKLSGNSATAPSVNAIRLEYAITNADSEINSYLKGRYKVPFSQVPSLIKSLSISLTLANLYSYTYPRTIVPYNILKRREQAIEILNKLQNGELYLEMVTPTVDAPPSILSNKSGYQKPLKTSLNSL